MSLNFDCYVRGGVHARIRLAECCRQTIRRAIAWLARLCRQCSTTGRHRGALLDDAKLRQSTMLSYGGIDMRGEDQQRSEPLDDSQPTRHPYSADRWLSVATAATPTDHRRLHRIVESAMHRCWCRIVELATHPERVSASEPPASSGRPRRSPRSGAAAMRAPPH